MNIVPTIRGVLVLFHSLCFVHHHVSIIPVHLPKIDGYIHVPTICRELVYVRSPSFVFLNSKATCIHNSMVVSRVCVPGSFRDIIQLVGAQR